MMARSPRIGMGRLRFQLDSGQGTQMVVMQVKEIVSLGTEIYYPGLLPSEIDQ